MRVFIIVFISSSPPVGSPIVVGILLGMVLIVFLTLAMIISIAPACYRNIKANMKGSVMLMLTPIHTHTHTHWVRFR